MWCLLAFKLTTAQKHIQSMKREEEQLKRVGEGNGDRHCSFHQPNLLVGKQDNSLHLENMWDKSRSVKYMNTGKTQECECYTYVYTLSTYKLYVCVYVETVTMYNLTHKDVSI